ncbi:MAG: hypothetical protein Q9212_002960 [Teloschistes hypoglaucus]
MASPSSAAQEELLAQERADRYDLRHWHPAWDAQNNHFDCPNRFALRGETLFQKLCEAIVRYIEDPTLMNAGEWLDTRISYRDIIALGTFKRFVDIMQEVSAAFGNEDAVRLRHMILSPPHELLADLDDGSLNELMNMVAQLKDDKIASGGGFLSADEWTYRSLRLGIGGSRRVGMRCIGVFI